MCMQQQLSPNPSTFYAVWCGVDGSMQSAVCTCRDHHLLLLTSLLLGPTYLYVLHTDTAFATRCVNKRSCQTSGLSKIQRQQTLRTPSNMNAQRS
jgi:hypothetical protein